MLNHGRWADPTGYKKVSNLLFDNLGQNTMKLWLSYQSTNFFYLIQSLKDVGRTRGFKGIRQWDKLMYITNDNTQSLKLVSG